MKRLTTIIRIVDNLETIIAELLEKLGLTYETGDLTELISNAPDNKQTMDFIIPNKKNPLIIAKSSFLATTSSRQEKKTVVHAVASINYKAYQNKT